MAPSDPTASAITNMQMASSAGCPEKRSWIQPKIPVRSSVTSGPVAPNPAATLGTCASGFRRRTD